MHDGASVTPEDAILRHSGEATPATDSITGYRKLTTTQKNQILTFLASI